MTHCLEWFYALALVLSMVELEVSCHGDLPATCSTRDSISIFKIRTKQVPVQTMECLLNGDGTQQKYHLDVATILTKVKSGNDVVFYFAALCKYPSEVVFNNSRNITKKNVILYLQFIGNCNVSVTDISMWGKATDLRVFFFHVNATLLDGNATVEPHSKFHGLENIGTLVFEDTRPHKIPDIFTKYVWTKMAEVSFLKLKLKTIPTLNRTMPFLQTLELSHNNLTRPPEFPWCNSTLELPRHLTRNAVANHHYQAGTIVDPKIYRRFFDLDYNNIQDLSTHRFRGFLDKLSLKGNGVRMVGPNCFRDLRGIQVIDLSQNKLHELPSSIFNGLHFLSHIRLSENKMSVIPETIFQGLSKTRRVDLDRNSLNHIPKGLFHGLQNLETVHLEKNNISIIEDGAFPVDSSSLQEIYLQQNNINSLPMWLFLQRGGRKIDLSSNMLTFENLSDMLDNLNVHEFFYKHRETASSTEFKLQEKVKHASFAKNKLTTINIEGFNETKKLAFELFLRVYEVDMSDNPIECDCRILNLVRWLRSLMHKDTRINPRHFQSWKCANPPTLGDKSILSIHERQFACKEDLELCPIRCLCFVRALDGSVVIDCKKRNLTQFPRRVPAGKIEMLLQNNNIRQIPLYRYLENVTALYLTQNNIQQLNASIVQKIKHIRILYIDSNKLTELPKNIQKLNFTELALGHNFLRCDCETQWLKYWLRNRTRTIVDVQKVLCSSKNVQGKAIVSLSDEEFVCVVNRDINNKTGQNIIHDKTLQIVACTMGGLFLATFAGLVLLRIYGGEIKVFMFTHFNWHPFDKHDDSDPSKIYDAFVSYSGEDHQWVVNTLQRRLESHVPPYKLCIHDRDFLVGMPIQENIMNSVNQSKRMLMVLSRGFLQSEWCLLEFRAAHRKVLEERINYLIIILFDNVDLAEMDDEMKLYMRTNTYLSVSNNWFWQKLFYAMPQSSIRELRKRHLSSTSTNYGMETSSENAYELRETVIQ